MPFPLDEEGPLSQWSGRIRGLERRSDLSGAEGCGTAAKVSAVNGAASAGNGCAVEQSGFRAYHFAGLFWRAVLGESVAG